MICTERSQLNSVHNVSCNSLCISLLISKLNIQLIGYIFPQFGTNHFHSTYPAFLSCHHCYSKPENLNYHSGVSRSTWGSQCETDGNQSCTGQVFLLVRGFSSVNYLSTNTRHSHPFNIIDKI